MTTIRGYVIGVGYTKGKGKDRHGIDGFGTIDVVGFGMCRR